jgi:ribosomal protein L7/L12
MSLSPIQFALLVQHANALNRKNGVAMEIKLQELWTIANPVPSYQGGHVNVEQEVTNLLTAMRDNRKIDAIKAYRMLTGQGLRESKDTVERFMPACGF